jgi:hypothetical protein
VPSGFKPKRRKRSACSTSPLLASAVTSQGGVLTVVSDLGVEPVVQGVAQLGVAGGVGGACSVGGGFVVDGDSPAVCA